MPARNAALALGLAIGTLARDGRDKLTFVADPEIASFGVVAGAAARREHRQARRRDRAGGPGAAGRGDAPTGRIGRSSGSRSRAPTARRRPTDARPTRCWTSSPPPATRHPDRPARRDRPRRGVRALGVRDGDRRDRPQDRPVRPAERRGGQGEHARAAGAPADRTVGDGGGDCGPRRSWAAARSRS